MGRIMTCLVLLLPAQISAQRLGTIELSGFGRYTAFSQDRPLDNAFGIGGALGVYFTNRIKLSADASYSPTKIASTDVDAAFVPVHVRLSYELPLSSSVRALAGGGYVANTYRDAGNSDSGIGGVLGVRLQLSESLWLNAQYTRDWMPPWMNGLTIRMMGDPPLPVVIEQASDIHNGFEAGISKQFGVSRTAVVAAVPVTPPPSSVQSQVSQQATTPPPPTQPQPQPQPQPQQRPAAEKAAEPAVPERFVTLDAVHFDFDRADLRAEEQAQLTRVAAILRANPNATVVIEGHADRRGTDEYNQRLSQRRAEAVRRFLISQNVDARQIEAVPLGERKPAETGNDEAAYARNRRVEFRLPINVRLREPR
jgi:peptidoglycan-associated lipoprotein